ncbi:MAG: hypothetical protein ACYCW6_15785 [Candidatus Xenobia bacterium]
MTSRQRLFMWVPQKWTRELGRTLSVYPWQRHTVTSSWCRPSILTSDWINTPLRWVMHAPRRVLLAYLPDTWSLWPRRADATPPSM